MNTFRFSMISLMLFLLSSCGVFNKTKKPDEGNVSSTKIDKQAKIVIDAAREKLGSPYKFGGATDDGYDCSGLVFTSFKEIGMTIPRTSSEQATIGKDVAFEKVRPGDLVFFATKKGEGKISHVGIVTEIKAKEVVMFIHAANTGVKEDNIYTPYYFNSFVKAKRPY